MNDITFRNHDPDVMLELWHVTKRFGGLTAVGDVSFKIKKGEIYALIGPNGAGKTTIFNLITGVYALTEGRVIFNGTVIGQGEDIIKDDMRETEVKPFQKKPYDIMSRGMARTFQNIRLFKSETVYNNVLTACHAGADYNIFQSLWRFKFGPKWLTKYYWQEKALREKTEELLKIMGIWDQRDMIAVNLPYRHVTIPAQNFTEATMTDGIGFDASNYGYAVVEKSDMVFIPDPDTAQIDPFCEIPTLSMTGNAMIIDYPANRPLDQYPRNIVRAAEQYMRDSGIADTMLILPEFEFYLFDDVAWKVAPNEIGMSLDAEQAHWNGDINGRGVIVPRQGHYHIAKPLDRTYECRSEMCLRMEEAGIPIKYHHPEVGGAGQFEIEPKLGEMSKMADATMLIKYIIHNTALKYGKSATFMPKPVYGEAGSGMHVHMLLLKNGEPVFSDDNGYSHLSQEAHWFIGGLLKHVSSLCAITNPSTNSFKRLVPGFEAPVTVGYATSNRSAVIRIPAYAKTPNLRRFEIRNPDATCNPYFCYAALLMAGLDGIENKIDPHENGWGPYDVNLYTLSDEEKAKLSHLPTSLDAALDALEADHDYLTRGGVFPEALLKNFIAAKRKECAAMAAIPHPAEFERYYNL